MASQPTKYCDLVMKGGITSGIVYPNAVLALREQFRFKNIGGTSAGAIAAAACAAAALGDRRKFHNESLAHESDRVGFEGLEQVAGELGSAGFIYRLLQPAFGVRTAFRLLVVLAGTASWIRKLLWLLWAPVAVAPIEILILLAALLSIAYLLDGTGGVIGAALPNVILAYLGGIVFAVARVARVARRNLLGLCTGCAAAAGRTSQPALAEWMHAVLQQLSGKPDDQPLVFADLWAAKRYPGEPASELSISLRMITTGVSHHEPRSLPFEDGEFWFRRDEFDRLFPRKLVDWMVQRPESSQCIDGVDYYRLPAKGELPVLVAMRMSLSFPLLISAVPLHEPARRAFVEESDDEALESEDHPPEKSILQSTERLSTGGRRTPVAITAFRRCWFSDGGIASNFPIHLFDAPLPRWPTFAINLVYPGDADGDQPAVFLPGDNRQGWQRKYQSFARSSALGELTGLLFAIVSTMQNWRDLLQSRAPGHRDRIVHIALTADEGGMNLNMPQEHLTRISAKGTLAGRTLSDFSFENHYWVRWRNLASAWQRYTIKIAESVGYAPKIPDYENAYNIAANGVPDPPSYPFRSADRSKAAQALLHELAARGEEWKDLGPDFTSGAPRPMPQLQITPTY